MAGHITLYDKDGATQSVSRKRANQLTKEGWSETPPAAPDKSKSAPKDGRSSTRKRVSDGSGS